MSQDTVEPHYHERRVLKAQVEALRSALAIAQIGAILCSVIAFVAGYLVGTK